MFVFQEVPPGTEVLRIRHLAYGEEVKGLVLEEGQAYRVEGKVSMEPIEMEGIEVSESGEPQWIWSEIVSMDVEAMEVYKGPATLPAEFAGIGVKCAVAIWTKRGG
mgnify:FL=1